MHENRKEDSKECHINKKGREKKNSQTRAPLEATKGDIHAPQIGINKRHNRMSKISDPLFSNKDKKELSKILLQAPTQQF